MTHRLLSLTRLKSIVFLLALAIAYFNPDLTKTASAQDSQPIIVINEVMAFYFKSFLIFNNIYFY